MKRNVNKTASNQECPHVISYVASLCETTQTKNTATTFSCFDFFEQMLISAVRQIEIEITLQTLRQRKSLALDQLKAWCLFQSFLQVETQATSVTFNKLKIQFSSIQFKNRAKFEEGSFMVLFCLTTVKEMIIFWPNIVELHLATVGLSSNEICQLL